MKPITLNIEDNTQYRQDLLSYFNDSFTTFEALFEIFVDETVFYKKSEPTRHAMLFYYAHTAVFFINKLILAKVITKRIDADLEALFAVGVDEMSWDNIETDSYIDISVKSIKEYRVAVKECVESLIKTLELPAKIGQDSPWWIVLMGIEHERIHIETSSVLHRQMPLKYIKKSKYFLPCEDVAQREIVNEMVRFDRSILTLGKSKDHHLFGWDNEYGELECDVESFSTTKYLISNGDFLKFVEDGGYENKSFWSDEGAEFLKKTDAKLPPFWLKDGKRYLLRVLDREIELPLLWAVEVNYLEAKAYCNYKSELDGVEYHLPDEAQWHVMLESCDVVKDDIYDESRANLGFFHYASASPVDLFRHNRLYDVVGNVWQWSETQFEPYKGFEPHYAYDDFSVPTFDKKHNLIKGGSFASTGNEITKHSRYAFRRHFHQHAGFRMVCSSVKNSSEPKRFYESNTLIAQYCEFHYGKTYFDVKNFPLQCAQIASDLSANTLQRKALDLGCATGRSSFELAKFFDKVDGVDFSTRFIQIATTLQQGEDVDYDLIGEGELSVTKSINLGDIDLLKDAKKVTFSQADACNLGKKFGGYDLILCSNLIDRLYAPKEFLQMIHTRVNQDGILILISPYTWLEEFTAKQEWLGGFVDERGVEVRTLENIESILAPNFQLIHTEDIEFVIRESERKYQHTVSQLSAFKRVV